MHKKLGVVLLAVSMLLIPGCTKNQDLPQSDGTVISLKKENEELKKTISNLEQELQTIKEENEAFKQTIEEASMKEYALYTRDVDTWEITELSKIKVKQDLSLQEKLQAIADALSKECFEGLTIEVKEIKSIGNNEIAIIDLKDEGTDKEPSWMVNFFQGSTGAGITKTAIEESFLQRNTDDKWVDGIEIYYNGKVLSSDHIEFNGIIYR